MLEPITALLNEVKTIVAELKAWVSGHSQQLADIGNLLTQLSEGQANLAGDVAAVRKLFSDLTTSSAAPAKSATPTTSASSSPTTTPAK